MGESNDGISGQAGRRDVMKDLLCEKLIRKAQRGDEAGVAEMLEAGADPNGASRYGTRTALQEAASFGCSGIVLLLLSHGAQIEARDGGGQTALHCACLDLAGGGRSVETLISAGADVNVVDKTGKTPLHWLAMADSPKGVEALISAGADPCAVDRDGCVPGDYTRNDSIKRLLDAAMEKETLRMLSEEASRSASAASRRRI